MIEYTIRDTESGREHSGSAETVALMIGGAQRDKGKDCGFVFFGVDGNAKAMVFALTNAALEPENMPARMIITNLHTKFTDVGYMRQIAPLLLTDAIGLIYHLKDKVKAYRDVDIDFAQMMREAGFGDQDLTPD